MAFSPVQVVWTHVTRDFGSAGLNFMLTWQGAGDRCRNEKVGEVDAGCVCSLTVVTGLWYVSGECGKAFV